MKILELFAGSRSVGNVAESMGFEVFSLDIHPFKGINLVGDILDVTLDQIPFEPDMIWASPPCTFFSVASIGHHWHPDHTPKTDNALLGVKIVQKTLDIIDAFPSAKWFMENPRGKLRKLEVVKDRPRAEVCYCKYGDTRMKPTDIWSNHIASIFQSGWQPRPMCFNGNKDCHHEAAPRGSKTGTQGLANAYEKSKIPEQLIREILESID